MKILYLLVFFILYGFESAATLQKKTLLGQKPFFLPPVITKHPACQVTMVMSTEERKLNLAIRYRKKTALKLECEATGVPEPRYKWKKDGTWFDHTISNRINQLQNTGTLVFLDPEDEDNGWYQCFADNGIGKAASETAFVLIVQNHPQRYLETNATELLPFGLKCHLPEGWPKWQVYWVKGSTRVETDRITVDPVGDLWFSYVTIEDASDDYTCVAKAAHVSIPVTKVKMKIVTKENDTESNLEYNRSPLKLQYVSEPEKIAISGQPTEIACIYGGLSRIEVTWQKNSEVLKSQQHLTLSSSGKILRIGQVQSLDKGTYTCEVGTKSGANQYGFYHYHTMILKVYEAPVFEVEPQNLKARKSDKAVLNCSAFGVPPPRVTWYYNGRPLPTHTHARHQFTDQSLTISDVTEADTGNYACNASNEVGYIYKGVYFIVEKPPGSESNDGKNTLKVIASVFGLLIILVIFYYGIMYIIKHKTKQKPYSKISLYTCGNGDNRYKWEGLDLQNTKLPVVQFCSGGASSCHKDGSGTIWFYDVFSRTTECDVMSEVSAETLTETSHSLDDITFDPWHFNRSRLLLLDVIGKGKFGRIYLSEALFEDETGKIKHRVAVKTTQVNAPDFANADLIHEVKIMARLGNHCNVVKFIGACTEAEPTFLIMELLTESLHQFLRRAQTEKNYELPVGNTLRVTSKLLLNFAVQTAKGMHHVSSKGIIHRDLAARNILLSRENLVCKISDFGLARQVAEKEVYVRRSKVPLPMRWMAPESLSFGETSFKSDVWSYGVVLWELAALGARPYPGKGLDAVKEMVCSGKFMEMPKSCKSEVYDVMCRCWTFEPQRRPDFLHCADVLSALLEKDADYIQLLDEYFKEN